MRVAWNILYLGLCGGNAQFGRAVNRDRWRELMQIGPGFTNDRMMADEAFDVDRLDRGDYNVENRGPRFDSDGRDSLIGDLIDMNQAADESTIVRSMNSTDPMDPEYCCDEPRECLCQFGCVEQNYTCPVDVVVAVDVCHCDNKRWIKTIEFLVHLVEELKEKGNSV